MRTDTTGLKAPEWLTEAPQGEEFDPPLGINTTWWHKTLSSANLQAEAPPAVDGRVSRSAIFQIASHGIHEPQVARSVLWASLAWGEGTRAFRNPSRVRSFLTDVDRNSELLTNAADLATSEPTAAYRLLNGKIKNLGPAFFTKFLYFAGAGDSSHPSLILDARVAAALRDHCGWESLRIGGAWPADTYGRYCTLLQRWARELPSVDNSITPELLEFRLFSRR